MNKTYYVYIATNQGNDVLYTGITNNLERRMCEHKHKLTNGFTAKYNVNKVVFYEMFGTSQEAIAAEKKIKSGSRKKKIDIIMRMNPNYQDLLKII